jgi:hypothetical protein
VGFEASGGSILGLHEIAGDMAMPRRAMKDLGFQACCLRCDAPDTAGSERCRGCISHHKKVREEIAKAPKDEELYQFARELLALAASPHRHDHDEVHGPFLIEQQYLASKLTDAKPQPTPRDLESVFETQAATKKANPIRDIANQNPWKDELPSEEVLQHMADSLEAEDVLHGARTIPSRPIDAVDRSDRLGEDRDMIDKIMGEQSASEAPKPLKKVVESATIEERVRNRKDWDDSVSKVSDLLDDDLDL